MTMALLLLLGAGCQSKENVEQNSGLQTEVNSESGGNSESGATEQQTVSKENTSGTVEGETGGTFVITNSEVESIREQLQSLAVIDDEDKTVATADASGKTVISFDGTSVQVDGDGCLVEGTTVTIQEAGTYILQGDLQNGGIIVDTDKKSIVRLVLNGVTITNDDSAAIFVKKSLKTVISLAEGTVNTLTDGTQYVYAEEGEAEPSAALYSKSDLTINGTGTLVVNGNYNDAIQCKDSLKLLGGVYRITSADDGIIGKDMLVIENGSYTINAEGDGMKSSNDTDETLGFILILDGEFSITAENDAIQAETKLVISDGRFQIVTGGGSSNAPAHTSDDRFGFGGWFNGNNATTEDNTTSSKGLKAGTAIQIDGGTFVMDTCDDAVHSNGTILLTAGDYTISSGDDGVHADTVLVIDGGTLTVTESYEGLEAVAITVNGGEISIAASDDGINAAGDAVLASEDMTDGTQGNMQMPGDNAGGWPNRDNGMGGFGGGKGQGMGGMMESTNANLTINGGTIYVSAQGDGLDANGSIVINGGTVFVDGPTNSGNAGLDYATTAEFNGGTVAIAGSLGMATTPTSDSKQASIALTFSKVQAAGTTVVLCDAGGKEIFRYTPSKEFQHLILSSSEIKSGATYCITYGSDGSTGTFTASDGAVTYVSSDGSVTTGGNAGGFGGFGGFGGGQKGGRH